ncbi:hypothetical protein B0H21DRAFT_557507 [Amylocystis lapponica]|nr:hypothetical protein B0H21DRAFT_557507 [Amylocystis lapponica]
MHLSRLASTSILLIQFLSIPSTVNHHAGGEHTMPDLASDLVQSQALPIPDKSRPCATTMAFVSFLNSFGALIMKSLSALVPPV